MGATEAHALVAFLTAPPDNGVEGWLVGAIKTKVKEYGARVPGGAQLIGLGSDDVYFDFVRCCVHSLVNLRFELKQLAEQDKEAVEEKKTKEPRLAADALSIQQSKAVERVVEMVVALGVIPNLLPGVGQPIEKRSKHLQDTIKAVPVKSILEKYRQLVYSIESLLELAKFKGFSTLITTRHVSDIMGCLIQISYAPLMKPKTPEPEDVDMSSEDVGLISEKLEGIQVKEEVFEMTAELHQRLSKDQERFKLELERILEKTYQPLVVRSLLVLQSSCKASKAPRWFVNRVGSLLFSRLCVEGGVMSVVRGVLDLGGGVGDMDWKQVNIVAEVLGSPPQGKFSDTEEYYKLVCPQLLEMLSSEESVVSMIACSSIKAVAERSLTLSRRHLLDPLLAPLTALAGSEEEAVAVSEQVLDDCIKNIFKVFVLGNDPNLMFVTHLEPVILILMNLFLSLAFGVSHLKSPVKQLVERYLHHSTTSTALAIIRAFALDELPESQPGLSRARKMNPDVTFVCGDEGGVKPIRKVDSDQSFYVSDDEKSIVVQDILEELKDKRLTTSFFLSLLEDLTVAMIDDDLEQAPEPELPEGGDVEEQLLALERQLDSTMHRMRRNLMVIRLLGLLSEENNFQENLLSESDKMIKFVSSSIKRAACGVAAGVESSVMAVQSLNMALSILSVHLTQVNVPMADWERMLESQEDLKILEDHADERISKISSQLYNLIATQGIVVEEVKLLKENTKKIQEETEKLKERGQEIKAQQKEQENQVLDERKAQLKAKTENVKKQKEERKKKRTQETRSAYESALFDVSDPLVPVQGHGLIALARLLEDKDAETIENMEKVRLLFQANLEDSDTYLYLASIRGLVIVARHSPDQVLEVLTREFALAGERKMEKSEEDEEEEEVKIRTKVGEALVQITRELGEVAPKYKTLLLNSFFSVANDPDSLVRASGLSLLGEICKLLRFSLGNMTAELLNHLAACARDQEVEVRAAAVMVLTMVLQGLGRDTLKVLHHHLRDIYRALKVLNGVEKEETVLCHVGLALEEIDNIMRSLLTPDPAMEKKIYVLDPPPDCF